MRSALVRVLATSPQVASALAAGMFFGAVGAAYPGAFLAEPRAPGLVGGAILGIAGAGFGGVLWGPLLGAWVGGASFSTRRILDHLNGRRVIASRTRELLALATVTFGIAIAGGASGVVASAVQPGFARGSATSLAPSPETLVVAICICLGATLIGWGLALALRSAAAGSAAYFLALSVSMLAAGLIYVAPGATPIAGLAPFGLLVAFASDQFYARQYLGQHATELTVVAAAVWTAGLAGSVAVRLRSRVG